MTLAMDTEEMTEGPVSEMADHIALAIDHLNAYYGSVQAVHDVTVPILRHSTTAIIGPSGCGKSTVLRCLNRMHEVVPRARITGRVLLEGQNMYDPGVDPVRVRRRIGMLFQRPNPFPTMSIFDNVVAG